MSDSLVSQGEMPAKGSGPRMNGGSGGLMHPVYYAQIRYNLVETARQIALATPALDADDLRRTRIHIEQLHRLMVRSTAWTSLDEGESRSMQFAMAMDRIFGTCSTFSPEAEAGIRGIVVKELDEHEAAKRLFPRGAAISAEGAR